MNRLLVPALLLCGCLGKVDPTVTGQPGDPSWTGGPDQPGAPSTAVLGARRLTRAEYVQTVRDLVDAQAPVTVEALAIDEGVPFDNDITMQHASEVLIDGADTIAEQVAVWAMTQPAVKARLYGCTPSGPSDATCFASFVDRMGRRALRRPLTDPERQAFIALQSESIADASFDSGAELVLRALLSHPGLLFRFENGVAKSSDGEITLSGYEIATRLSYLLLGSTPDDALLDAAERGELVGLTGRVAAADRLVADPKARAHLQRFHSMWLGYSKLSDTDPLNASMRKESDALVGYALFDGPGDYAELFRSDKTFVDSALAANYGLPAPAKAAGDWVTYPDPQRRGILSHGAVLAYGAKNGDTSPTRRGIYVRTRLLCQTIGPPPPNVNADKGPVATTPNACKSERYQQHAAGTCAGCHAAIDPIGFGLEQFDSLGRFRSHDDGRPECALDGKGEVTGTGTFSGPAELGALVSGQVAFENCVAEKLYTYTTGRTLRTEDRAMVLKLGAAFGKDGRRFTTLVRELVSDYTFTHRREDQ